VWISFCTVLRCIVCAAHHCIDDREHDRDRSAASRSAWRSCYRGRATGEESAMAIDRDRTSTRLSNGLVAIDQACRERQIVGESSAV
jgi:hypothetical protein